MSRGHRVTHVELAQQNLLPRNARRVSQTFPQRNIQIRVHVGMTSWCNHYSQTSYRTIRLYVTISALAFISCGTKFSRVWEHGDHQKTWKAFFRAHTNKTASSIDIAPNEDGMLQFCINYRTLNVFTKRDLHQTIWMDEYKIGLEEQ